MANFFDFMSSETSPIDVPVTKTTDSNFFSNLLDQAVSLTSQRQTQQTQVELERIRSAANTPVATQGTASVTASITPPAGGFLDNLPPLAIPIVLGIVGFIMFRMGVFK